MKINLHTPIEDAQVQIIPLIDVIFCILTFFILASLQFTRQQAINVDLPKASSATAGNINTSQSQNILPVTIDAVGQTYVEKQPIQREQLAGILRNYLQKNPNGTLVLNASRSATYNDVIELLDLLRQVGGDRVSLGIIPGSSDKPASSSPLNPPSFPVNPGAAPVTPFNPQGELNLNSPAIPNSVPFPAAPGQSNTGSSPQQSTAPGKTNSAP
ncbi:MAG: biopolymer transporter ExbD [Pelatocladus maniniholoensis HA4357-MV3]|jgi:biopolymer transport protein ExbD|uniref:Biopolymer transporter ExbD n=1 Tax=Pelatocladus maniniholoensis HA4357-MV3 TaxID=1117104 RepID=A0A9E3H8S1_9NOST|nr:biopolymer transporter ExbD [Pelatocladus maniniholoensis HA4357-MV3]BAZ67621.1 biopolymer transport protein ExbD/TolR [Fischerella sp. NIES-4106]